MKYSSHYYLRSDGSLGLYPIIEVDEQGVIKNIVENPEGLFEQQSVSFFSGVIIPGLVAYGSCQNISKFGYLRSVAIDGENPELTFSDKESFCKTAMSLSAQRADEHNQSSEFGSIQVGLKPGLVLVDGFSVNEFVPIALKFKILQK